MLQYASETLAAQIEGAATSVKELKGFCAHAPALTSRLAQEGYNITVITNAICTASMQSALKSNTNVQALTRAASSKIWVVQALGTSFQISCCCLHNLSQVPQHIPKVDDKGYCLGAQLTTEALTLYSFSGSTLGNAKALCNIFDAEGGDNVGLDGAFVKQEVCGVSG